MWLNMTSILRERWIAGVTAIDGCGVGFKQKLKTIFPNTNSDLIDWNIGGSNYTFGNSVMSLNCHK